MKKQLIIASAALLLGTFACKKKETSPPPIQQQGLEANASSGNEVKQKMFDLSTDKTTDFIVNLKSKMTNNNSLSKSSQNLGATTKDTSLWEIEALLNFDFDKATSSLESNSDSLNYDININTNNTVDFTEISSAYMFFTNQINQHLVANSSEKVKLVDVTATESNNKLQVNAHIIYTSDNSNQKVNSPCDDYANPYSASWSTYWPNLYGCPASTLPDGPTSCNVKLNCTTYNSGCAFGFYWANVVTIKLGNGSPWAGLYLKANQPNCCFSQLNYSALNYAIAQSKAYGISNKPTAPSGYLITNFKVIDRLTAGVTPATMTGWWELDITYGVPTCSPPAGG